MSWCSPRTHSWLPMWDCTGQREGGGGQSVCVWRGGGVYVCMCVFVYVCVRVRVRVHVCVCVQNFHF